METNAAGNNKLFGGRSRLHQVSADGEVDDCDSLLKAGENPNAVDDVGRSPLHYAARDGRGEVCERLIQGDADIHIRSKDGWSALHYGARGGWTDVCETLLKHGANVHVKAKDGRTALHYAAANRWCEVGKLLIRYGARVTEVDEGGNTPLHLAAQYAGRYSEALELCILFIEKGADLTIGNQKNKTPLDWLPKGCSELEKVIRRAEQRAKYGDLLKCNTKPIEVVKLFLCGASAAGKTTLKKSLTNSKSNTSEEASTAGPVNKKAKKDLEHVDIYNPTPGIDIEKREISGAGEFCIWDCAGQIEYHVTHAMFLGADNAIFVVVYDLSKTSHHEDLHYWLRLLRAGHDKTKTKKPKVLVVATHLDEIRDQRLAYTAARRNLQDAIHKFGGALDIVDEAFAFDGRDAHSQGILFLRQQLKGHAGTIRKERTMPKLVEAILDQRTSWYDEKHPVLKWDEFCSRVTDLYPDIKEELITTVTAYLSDMGEIYIAQLINPTSEDFVIMDTQWLGTNVIGRILAGEEFPTHFQKLPERPYYTKQDLEEFLQYGCEIEFRLVVSLLEHLKLLHRCTDGTFLIPCKLPVELPQLVWENSSKYSEYYGRRIECSDQTDMFTPNVFPRVQQQILEELKAEHGVANLTRSSIKVAAKVEGMIHMTRDKRAIHVCVRGRGWQDRGACHSLLQSLTTVIHLELQQRSPGTMVATRYLSSASVKSQDDLENVLHYEKQDLINAELGDGIVRHSEVAQSEPLVDILCSGWDTTLVEHLGKKCGYQWVKCDILRKVYRHLDCKNLLGQDYRSVAQVCGISELELESIKETCLQRGESITSAILTEVKAGSCGRRITIGDLLWLVRQSGVLDNQLASAALGDFENEESLEDHQPDFAHISHESLKWRNMIRRHHSQLRVHIDPSSVLPNMTMLTDEDQQHIQQHQDREGKIKAADLFLYTLIKMDNIKAYQQFLDTLADVGCDTLAQLMKHELN